ncbi:MAG: histidine phosphatase family protein [Ignavibacteriaceae bacterium]
MRKPIIRSLILMSATIIVFAVNCNNLFAQENNTKTKGTRTLYLIRHGQYDHDDDRSSDIGKALVPLGIAQARLVANRLKSLPVKMISLISSTMTRARQTAMIINQDFPELELQLTRLIRECTPPTWREDIMDGEDPEELKDCTDNLDAALSKYFIPSPDEKDRNDIIVCHGNVIRYFVTKVLKVETMSWLQMTTGNCGLTVVRIKPDGSMKLVSFNDMGHIPANLRTVSGFESKSKELVMPE